MAERARTQVYSIAAHRGFADALVAGLLPRYRDGDLGLARLTLFLPSSRAARTISEAFVRLAGEQGLDGLLMPRMAVVGDLDLGETLGAALDPIGAADNFPPAADPMRRWLRLAQFIREEMADQAPPDSALLRLAQEQARTMDRLLVEDIGPEELLQERVLDRLSDLSGHWRNSLRLFARVQIRWLDELAQRNELDVAARRNRLFDYVAQRWKQSPPQYPVVAAGVTSAAPALARLLRTIAEMPNGSVILPDLDLSLADSVWEELGRAGAPVEAGDAPFALSDAIAHPQYHLKLLLNRMGIARSEVQHWHRAGAAAAPPARSQTISNLFLPAEASASWVKLPADKRRLSNVRVMEAASLEEEAQAIALLVREALETPEKRIAVVTPDRGLATRIVAHLRRWNIAADDSAGQPLAQSVAGRVLLLLAELVAEHAAPASLMALLEHPLVQSGEGRAQWLERARALELELRGPRPAPGFPPLRACIARIAKRDEGADAWWASIEKIVGPLLSIAERKEAVLADLVGLLAEAAEALCGQALWAREDGRALSAFVGDLRMAASEVGTMLDPLALHAVLRDTMDRIAVRPPYGGHPRVAIYGLLESRMTRADLVICGGLNEGVWPQRPSQDILLAPPVLRALGVPGADFRIGLSAHDLAGAMGAPEVVLSRARRDVDGPAIPSRFFLRVHALLGDLLDKHVETHVIELTRAIDAPDRQSAGYPRPSPKPSAEQRDVAIAVTALDRLRGDPYQFYAQSILGLRRLDPLDAEPSPAWQGEVAHRILERWHKEQNSGSGVALGPIADEVLAEMNAHPLMRGLWRPRLFAALEWIEQQILGNPERKVIAVEQTGAMVVDGVRIHGRADRIDRLSNGQLAIVDYKTGMPPSPAMVESGYALQLGLIGLLAKGGGIEGVRGEPALFEYWSLGRSQASETGFGYIRSPVKADNNRSKLLPEEFLPQTEMYLREAIAMWIKGDHPFTAKLNPDYPGYADYDQLMRLDEWQGRFDGGEAR